MPDNRDGHQEIDALAWGDRLAVMGFRACIRRTNLLPIEEAFARTAGAHARAGYDAFITLVSDLKQFRRRPLDAAIPRSGSLTHDERAWLAALAAAGAGDLEEASARLAWLAGRTPDAALLDRLTTVAQALGFGDPAP